MDESGNQQERLEELSPEFIGGLLTGECWIGLTLRGPHGSNKRSYVVPAMGISMKEPDLIERLSYSLKRYGIPHWVHHGEKPGLARIHISGMKRMVKFLTWIIPHLAGTKKKCAINALEFCEYRLSLPKGSALTETDLRFVRKSRALTAGNGLRGGKYAVDLDKLSRILRDHTPDPSGKRWSELTGDRESAEKARTPADKPGNM